MEASGLAPGSLTFEQYRTWLNDFWLQKITNTLHDIYCLKGLEVSSPDQREPVPGLRRLQHDQVVGGRRVHGRDVADVA